MNEVNDMSKCGQTIHIDPNKEKLIVKLNMVLKSDTMQKIRDDIKNQFNTGVVVLPNGVDYVILPKDEAILYAWEGYAHE